MQCLKLNVYSTCIEFFQSEKISNLFKSWLLKLDDDLDIIHNDSDIEIGHNVDTSV